MSFQDIEPEESNEFRTDSFVDTITAIEIIPKTINEDIKDMVTFSFENGAPLELWPPRDGWADVKGYEDIGKIINNLRKSGIKFQVDVPNSMIRTVPSIIGAKVAFKCTKNEKTVRGEVRTYTNWSIDNISMPDVADETQSDESNSELLGQVMKDLEIILNKEPLDMRGIIKGYGVLVTDRDIRIPRLKLKESALSEMVELGLVEEKDGTYTLI